MNIHNNRVLSYLVWRLILRNPRLRLWLTNVFTKDEDVQLELFGARLLANKRREKGYWQAYKNSRQNAVFRDEAGPLINLALILEPRDTFIDIGANVGLYSSALSKLTNVFPNIKFYAVEPNMDTLQRLRQSLCDQNVQILDIALSDKNGDMEFVSGATSFDFGSKLSMSGFQIENKVTIVTGRTLDSLIIEGNSIILKIDVEGHERQVIDGAVGLLEAGRIKAIYLDGYSDKTLPDFLRTFGFHLYDGRSLRPVKKAPEHALIALHERHLK